MNVLVEVESHRGQRQEKPVEVGDSCCPGNTFFVRVEGGGEFVVRPLLPVGRARLTDLGTRAIFDRELEVE